MENTQLNWVQTVSNKILLKAFNLPKDFDFSTEGYEYIEYLFEAMDTTHRNYLINKYPL